MPTREEIQQTMTSMIDRFQPEKADGMDEKIQIDLSGDNGGKYWVKIVDKQVDAGEGDIESPSMTMRLSADDFYGLIQGDLNPMTAFMMGKIKVDNVGLGMKMLNLFNLG